MHITREPDAPDAYTPDTYYPYPCPAAPCVVTGVLQQRYWHDLAPREVKLIKIELGYSL